jgi:hypothetical protein
MARQPPVTCALTMAKFPLSWVWASRSAISLPEWEQPPSLPSGPNCNSFDFAASKFPNWRKVMILPAFLHKWHDVNFARLAMDCSHSHHATKSGVSELGSGTANHSPRSFFPELPWRSGHGIDTALFRGGCGRACKSDRATSVGCHCQ